MRPLHVPLPPFPLAPVIIVPLSVALLGATNVTPESVIIGGIGGVLLALAGLLLRALQSQQRAAAHTLKEQRESTDATIKQWQALAVHANTQAITIDTTWRDRLRESEERCQAEIHALNLHVDDLESEISTLRRRLEEALRPPAPPSTVVAPA